MPVSCRSEIHQNADHHVDCRKDYIDPGKVLFFHQEHDAKKQFVKLFKCCHIQAIAQYYINVERDGQKKDCTQFSTA